MRLFLMGEKAKLHMCDSAFFEFGIISKIESDIDYAKDINHSEGMKIFNCISIPDDYINSLIPLTRDIPTYLRKISRGYSGLDHYGVTLIPVESLSKFIDIIAIHQEKCVCKKERESLLMLMRLMTRAQKEQKYMICYGI